MRLWQYIVRRVLYLIPLYIGISIIVFFLDRAAGNPIDIMLLGKSGITTAERNYIYQYFGLDKDIVTQYFLWLTEFLQGNFGVSLFSKVAVSREIGFYAWNTIELQLVALIFSMLIAIPIGVLSARRQYSKADHATTTTALLLTSIPVFVLGLVGIMVFSYFLGLLPPGGAFTGEQNPLILGNAALDHAVHLILPATILTMADLATVVLLVRSSMLEVMRQDYILAAQASGLSDRTVVYRHALRNALIPVVTYVGLFLGGMLAGAPITETVFGWPGLGKYYVKAVQNFDFPVIQAVTMLITLMVLIANLVTDIAYAWVDPRIRLD